MGAGLVFGALAGGTAFAVVALVAGDKMAVEPFEIGAFFGAPLGAITAPLLSWVLLRRVPLGRMFVVCSAGTAIGGVIGWYTTGAEDIMLQPIGGALLGCIIAAITLWYGARTRSGNAMLNRS